MIVKCTRYFAEWESAIVFAASRRGRITRRQEDDRLSDRDWVVRWNEFKEFQWKDDAQRDIRAELRDTGYISLAEAAEDCR